jgi:hypothetical protein
LRDDPKRCPDDILVKMALESRPEVGLQMQQLEEAFNRALGFVATAATPR